MPTSMPMLPALAGLEPKTGPWLPFRTTDPADFPEAEPAQVLRLQDGDTLELVAGPVRRTIAGKTLVMYGYNGQYPGPLLRVPQGSEITVRFTNELDVPTAVHWHGIRIENRFDGVPGVTQDPVIPGGQFEYRVRFPDAGIYWYHPHLREDIQQDLGLYGNMMVDPAATGFWNEVNSEETLVLDDLLLDQSGLFPWGAETATHALMGRFGNVYLLNGTPDYQLRTTVGQVIRFYLTNVANTRTFNLRFGDAQTKLVGADLGRYEFESWVGSIPIAPAQRYVVEVRFDSPGLVPITNNIQAIDHFRGVFESRVDTLGFVEVSDQPGAIDHGPTFQVLRHNVDVTEELAPYRAHLAREPDRELALTMRTVNLPQTIVQIMSMDTLYYPPVEWNDAMPMMNYLSSGSDTEWIMLDTRSGLENMDIDWHFRVGDLVKIRLVNRTRSFHPMQHPIHLHGQRFIVLSHDGVAVDNLVWKDTVVIPVGGTVDLLMEVTNPGRWMAHCHIAEHLTAGMMMVFTVTE